MQKQPTITIVGGGAAALMLAARLDTGKYRVVLYERNKGLGHKFLVAGKGGFNLTHGTDAGEMIKEYYPDGLLTDCLRAFDNDKLRAFLADLGIETYVGSSRRVFPVKGIKPIEVLNAFLKRIAANGVVVNTGHLWKGFGTNGQLVFENRDGEVMVKSDFVVFALGGASWAKTGSAGDWLSCFEEQKVPVLPFQPSNCAIGVDWGGMLAKLEGKPLKNIALSCGKRTIKGELTMTKFGLEGSPVYAFSRCIRSQLAAKQKGVVFVDLKPALSKEQIVKKIETYQTGKAWSVRLRRSLNLSGEKMSLLRYGTSKETFINATAVAAAIKRLPLTITGLAPIDEAISTVGGIAADAVDEYFQLKELPRHFVIGEMLDWDAPTGGYLLQGCFSMADWVAGWFNLRI